MNERIEQLAKEAMVKITAAEGPISHTYFDKEKFAELIVQECLTIADKEHKMALEFEWDNDDTAQSIKDSIKQHFGVEE